MFFVLSKILKYLTEPFFWILFLLLMAFFKKNQITKRRFFINALWMIFVFSNTFLANEMALIWETKTRTIGDSVQYDVGIVLGGMSYYDKEYDRLIFKSGNDRLMQAIRLYKEKKIKKIFFSGGSGYLSDDTQIEGKFIEDYLLTIGIPREDLLVECKSKNTHENALFSKNYMDSLHLTNQKLLLITSSNHMTRSIACFKKVNLEVDPYPVDRIAHERKYTWDAFIIPDVNAYYLWNQVIHELVGYVTYKTVGYI